MMSPTALATLQAHRLRDQYAVHGRPVKIDDVEGIGIYSSPSYNPTLPEGGLSSDYSTTLRIKKADWEDYTTQSDFWTVQVQILQAPEAWLTLRVIACMDCHIAGEWKLNLGPLL